MRYFRRLTLAKRQTLILALMTALIGSSLFAVIATAAMTTTVTSSNLIPSQRKDRLIVTHLRAQTRPDGILLQWRPVNRADGYRIYHQTPGAVDGNSLWFDVDRKETSFLFTDVKSGERISFCIAVLRGKTVSLLSPPASALWIGPKSSASDSAP